MTTIFVFGSNLAGRHGKGAALFARTNKGAVYGVGEGRTGNAYAIPTKDHNLFTRSLREITSSVDTFIIYAAERPELNFEITPIGCGLAGYSYEQIMPLFKNAPDNCHLTEEWSKVLVEDRTDD